MILGRIPLGFVFPLNTVLAPKSSGTPPLLLTVDRRLSTQRLLLVELALIFTILHGQAQLARRHW